MNWKKKSEGITEKQDLGNGFLRLIYYDRHRTEIKLRSQNDKLGRVWWEHLQFQLLRTSLRPYRVAHTCNPTTWETEAKRQWWVWDLQSVPCHTGLEWDCLRQEKRGEGLERWRKAQQLRTLATLPEDPGISCQYSHGSIQPSVTPMQEIPCPLPVSSGKRHTHISPNCQHFLCTKSRSEVCYI